MVSIGKPKNPPQATANKKPAQGKKPPIPTAASAKSSGIPTLASKPQLTTAQKKELKVPTRHVTCRELLEPVLNAITEILNRQPTHASPFAAIEEDSAQPGKKRPRTEGDERPMGGPLDLHDELEEQLEKLGEIVETYQRALVPAIGHIVAHLSPVVLRKKSSPLAWSIAASIGALFGCALMPLLKSLIEHLTSEAERHSVFASPEKMDHLASMLYSSFQHVGTVDRCAAIGGVMCRFLEKLRLEINAPEKDDPAYKKLTSAEELTLFDEKVQSALRLTTATVLVCRPVLPELLSSATRIVERRPTHLTTNTFQTMSQLLCVLGAVQHPAVAPLSVPSIRMTVPPELGSALPAVAVDSQATSVNVNSTQSNALHAMFTGTQERKDSMVALGGAATAASPQSLLAHQAGKPSGSLVASVAPTATAVAVPSAQQQDHTVQSTAGASTVPRNPPPSVAVAPPPVVDDDDSIPFIVDSDEE